MRVQPGAVALALLLTCLGRSTSQAESPRQAPLSSFGTESRAEGELDPDMPVVFLNRCIGGCIVDVGPNDAIENTSSIIGQPLSLSAWNLGDDAWDDLVLCVKLALDPFNVQVLDSDPGSVPHIEAILAGNDQEYNRFDVGGFAPITCEALDNAMVFVIANLTTFTAQSRCSIALMEIAHAWGLEHTLLCEDPMSYLNDCEAGYGTSFVDDYAECGEYEPRACRCGVEPTRNSYSTLRDAFGERPPSPPEVAIVRPAAGATLRPGFPIEASAQDDLYIDRVEFFLDGELVEGPNYPPYVRNAPSDVVGKVVIEARAFDNRGAMTSDEIAVLIEGYADIAGSCEDNDDCTSKKCAQSEDGDGICTRECDPEAADCPNETECQNFGDVNLCWPTSDPPQPQDGGGCTAVAGGTHSAALTVLLALLCAVRSRGRRRAPTTARDGVRW